MLSSASDVCTVLDVGIWTVPQHHFMSKLEMLAWIAVHWNFVLGVDLFPWWETSNTTNHIDFTKHTLPKEILHHLDMEFSFARNLARAQSCCHQNKHPLHLPSWSQVHQLIIIHSRGIDRSQYTLQLLQLQNDFHTPSLQALLLFCEWCIFLSFHVPPHKMALLPYNMYGIYYWINFRICSSFLDV